MGRDARSTDDSENSENGQGPVLCRVGDLAATGAKGISLGSVRDLREIVVVATAAGPRAYANRCPHMFATLDTFPDRFLDEAREHLVCSTHGARFRVDDGECVKGPCLGFSLEPIAIVVVDGEVRLA